MPDIPDLSKIAKLPTSIERLEALVREMPKENLASKGPRNLPKPDARKKRRRAVRAARRASR